MCVNRGSVQKGPEGKRCGACVNRGRVKKGPEGRVWSRTATEFPRMAMTTPGHLVIWGCPRIYPDTVHLAPRLPRPSGLICSGMSQDVLGYPDTVATTPESQVQEVLSVLGCPRMSWDIPTQWLQPLSPRSKWFYLHVLGCPRMSWDIPTQWLQPLSPRSKWFYLHVLGCPRMSWDIPTQWLQPLSPRSKWSYLS